MGDLTLIDQTYKVLDANICLSPHSNFSFYKAENLKWEKEDVSNSLFNGSLFSGCEFTDVVFANSDLEGTRFHTCNFINCSLKSTDVHAVFFNNCKFIGVVFSDAVIADTTFYDCEFDLCKYSGFNLTQSVFEACQLAGFTSRGCSVTLNKFIKTTFTNSVFMNVFYYQIFHDCNFIDSSFEAYLAGYVYGLSEKNLQELHCIVMGEPVNYSIRWSLDYIASIYTERNMFLNRAFLELLAGTQPKIDLLLIGCISGLKSYFDKDVILKNDQITFLKQIIESLHQEAKVAPETYFIIDKMLVALLNKFKASKATSWEKSVPYVRELRNTIYFITIQYLNNIKTLGDIEANKLVTLKVVYETKPTMELIGIMKSNFPQSEKIILLKTERGSFIEWISCPENIVAWFGLFLQLIGTATPIVLKVMENREHKLKKDEEDMHSREVESTMKDISSSLRAISESLTTLNSMNEISIANQPKMETVAKIDAIVNFLYMERFMTDEMKFGYSQTNIKTVEVFYDSP